MLKYFSDNLCMVSIMLLKWDLFGTRDFSKSLHFSLLELLLANPMKIGSNLEKQYSWELSKNLFKIFYLIVLD